MRVVVAIMMIMMILGGDNDTDKNDAKRRKGEKMFTPFKVRRQTLHGVERSQILFERFLSSKYSSVGTDREEYCDCREKELCT